MGMRLKATDTPSRRAPGIRRFYLRNWIWFGREDAWLVAVTLMMLSWSARFSSAQVSLKRDASLPEDRLKSGDLTLHAFAPVAEATRYSVAKLDLDGSTVALGAIIDRNGLVITKASEIREGKLTCWLAKGKEVDAKLIAVDTENDLALVKINATGIKPIAWAADEIAVGQWAVTVGIEAAPMAVGVVSVPSRKILPKRAFIGVVLDTTATKATIARLMPGLGAEKAGLEPGDVILAVNDSPVDKRDHLLDTLRLFREGKMARLRVLRAGAEFDAVVEMMPEPMSLQRGFGRSESMNRLSGERSRRAEDFELAIQHDTVLQPWQCGGPLVNLEGKVVGLNIARAGRVASYALPSSLVKRVIQDLKTRSRPGVNREVSPKTPQP